VSRVERRVPVGVRPVEETAVPRRTASPGRRGATRRPRASGPRGVATGNREDSRVVISVHQHFRDRIVVAKAGHFERVLDRHGSGCTAGIALRTRPAARSVAQPRVALAAIDRLPVAVARDALDDARQASWRADGGRHAQALPSWASRPCGRRFSLGTTVFVSRLVALVRITPWRGAPRRPRRTPRPNCACYVAGAVAPCVRFTLYVPDPPLLTSTRPYHPLVGAV
jgi:hypothetical protein